jgi:hypothetical protein
MQNEQWAEIRTMLSKAKNMPEIVVDYLSVLNVLKQCVHGLGNMKIAYFNDLEVEQVESILFQYFGMKGWLLDLDLNPWGIYCTAQGNYELYEMKILSLTNLVDYDIINTSYKLCKKYQTIREEIENYD